MPSADEGVLEAPWRAGRHKLRWIVGATDDWEVRTDDETSVFVCLCDDAETQGDHRRAIAERIARDHNAALAMEGTD